MKELGLRYVTTDIEPRPGAIVIDLNQVTSEATLGNLTLTFDIVTNFGTTEHIANQLYSFKLLHDLVRVGGLIWCHVPMLGMLNHGYVNLTPKFWMGWRAHNDYELVQSWIDDDGTVKADNPTHYDERFGELGAFPLDRIINATLNLIVRKKRQALFVPPLDIATSRIDTSDLRRIYSNAIRSLYPEASEDQFNTTLESIYARRGL